MATLVSKDTSGIYRPGEGEAEITSRRTRSFKTFHRGGRAYRVAGQIGPIHYRLDPFDEREALKEIDLDLVASPEEEWDWENTTNGFQVFFRSERPLLMRTLRFIAKYQRAGGWVLMRPLLLRYENDAGEAQLVGVPLVTDPPEIDHDAGTIIWRDAFRSGIDFGYRRMPDRFEKLLIVQSHDALPQPRIGATGLRLVLVMAVTWLPGIRAANGFADGIALDRDLDFDGSLLEAIDERRDNPERFPFKDALDRDCFWMQDPVGRDSAEERHTIPVSWSLVRRRGRVACLVSVGYAGLTSEGLTYPVFIDTAIAEERVGTQTDDAGNMGPVYPGYALFMTTNTQLWAGYNSAWWQNPLAMMGLRYTPPIPQGAQIDNASIRVYSYGAQSLNAHWLMYGEDADDPGTFVATTHEPYNAYLARTAASSEWDIGTAYWYDNTWYWYQYLEPIVQEIVDRPGWSESNGMVFIVVSLDSQPSHEYRVVHSRDEGSNAPRFNCSYTEAGPSGWAIVIKPDE